MRTLQHEIERIVDQQGVVARRAHPELCATIAWLKRTGRLVPLLPGVYTTPSLATSTEIRVQAVGWWDRDAVVTGAAAARLTFWPKVTVPVITCAVRTQRPVQPGYRFVRRVVPPELIAERGVVRFTSPALTALDLCVETDGEAIDQVLRHRSATLDHLHQALALTPERAGNQDRRRLLLESRAQPWSAAERRFHRLLHAAGITGWSGNRLLALDGVAVYPDVSFLEQRLIVEIDGREFHSDPAVFESDRRRQNLFVVHGWRVLRFTVPLIDDEPELVIATVRAALGMAPAQ